jgi:catechol 2,3-dioxygenase-like lactoylglutathione lyase family enzyme
MFLFPEVPFYWCGSFLTAPYTNVGEPIKQGMSMNIDHVALNAVSLDEEIEFFVEFLGLALLQRWDAPRQAYVGAQAGPVIGLIENKDYDGSVFTMAHVALYVEESTFDGWVTKVQQAGLPVVAGPKEQRGGRTILFRSPSQNIIEICYPDVRTSIAAQAY